MTEIGERERERERRSERERERESSVTYSVSERLRDWVNEKVVVRKIEWDGVCVCV